MSLFNPYKSKKNFTKKSIYQDINLLIHPQNQHDTSKNFFTLLSQKLFEKVEYHDLYSDLVSNQQTNKNSINKMIPKRR